MEVINESLRIYSVSFEELTVKQMREICSGWSDQARLGGLILFYEEKEDKLLTGPSITERQLDFCVKVLSTEPKEAMERLERIPFHLDCNQTIVEILKKAIANRMKSIRWNDTGINPNSRFISVEGDIFQISKIVSVKKRDDGSRHYIEFYITNKRASIRKEYYSETIRNSEFTRIQKILEAA